MILKSNEEFLKEGTTWESSEDWSTHLSFLGCQLSASFCERSPNLDPEETYEVILYMADCIIEVYSKDHDFLYHTEFKLATELDSNN